MSYSKANQERRRVRASQKAKECRIRRNAFHRGGHSATPGGIDMMQFLTKVLLAQSRQKEKVPGNAS